MSASPTVKGNAGAVVQPLSRTWVRNEGETVVYTWEGEYTGVKAKYDAEKASPTQNWARLVLTPMGGGAARLEAPLEPVNTDNSESADGVFETRWELDRNVVNMPLRSAAFFTHADVTATILDRLDYIISKHEEPDWDNDADLTGYGLREFYYYYHRVAGVVSWEYSQYVLRHIRITSSQAVILASHTDQNRVVAVPVSSAFLIGTLPTDVEWLKQPPDVRKLTATKYELIQEYWGGTPTWSIIYGGTWTGVV